MTYAEASRDLRHENVPALEREGRIARDDDELRHSAVIMSSEMPSAKYSCSGSPLMLAKGRTAIDRRGLSVRSIAAARVAPERPEAPICAA